MNAQATQNQEQRNLETCAALYAATGSGDWQAAEDMLTEDFSVTEADTLPMAGVYRGKKALQELYQTVIPMMGDAELVVKGRTAGGEYVVYILEMRSPIIDKPVELTEVFRFAPDGRVAEIKPYYFDSEAVKRVAQGS